MGVVTQTDMLDYLENTVNLRREKLNRYRAQVNYLRDRLAAYVDENPEFALVKMLHSGSSAKGTALSNLNDLDVAVYLRPETVSDHELSSVLEYVRNLLVKAYHQMDASQFVVGRHAVHVSFKTSGLDVDVVPVIPNGKADDRGDIPNAETGKWVETSIPLHLQFIRGRKKVHRFFPELVRLTKWWRNEHDLKFKSFLIELIWAHILDRGLVDAGDLQDGLAGFFGYVVRSGLQEPIVFDDYYPASAVDLNGASVQVLDPVNPENNVAGRIDNWRRQAFTNSADEALDLVSAAASAHTKAAANEYYRRLFGVSFRV